MHLIARQAAPAGLVARRAAVLCVVRADVASAVRAGAAVRSVHIVSSVRSVSDSVASPTESAMSIARAVIGGGWVIVVIESNTFMIRKAFLIARFQTHDVAVSAVLTVIPSAVRAVSK